jgi:hypothetical protein
MSDEALKQFGAAALLRKSDAPPRVKIKRLQEDGYPQVHATTILALLCIGVIHPSVLR